MVAKYENYPIFSHPQQLQNVAVIRLLFVTRSVPPEFVSLESRMKEDESKGELWLIAVFLVLLALVVLKFFRH